jgi:hypothetical protein
MIFLMDFPIPPEGHPNARIRRSYITGGRMLPEPEKSEHVEAKH